VNSLDVLFREGDAERTGEEVDVLNGLHADDGKYVRGLMEEVC
jgi:hypothetical protein